MAELSESLKAAQSRIEATAAALAESIGAAMAGSRAPADQASEAELRESIGRLGREVVRLFAASKAADARDETAAVRDGARPIDEEPAEGETGWKGARA